MVLVVKNPPASAGDIKDTGSIPASGRSPGGGHGNPLQDSCLESFMNRGAWWAAVLKVAQSDTTEATLHTHPAKLLMLENFQLLKMSDSTTFILFIKRLWEDGVWLSRGCGHYTQGMVCYQRVEWPGKSVCGGGGEHQFCFPYSLRHWHPQGSTQEAFKQEPQ